MERRLSGRPCMERRLLGRRVLERREPIHLYRGIWVPTLPGLVSILGLGLSLLLLVLQLLSLLVLSFVWVQVRRLLHIKKAILLPLTRRLSYLGASPLFEIARVLVRLSWRHHSFRLASSNGMTHSTFPVESRMLITPER